MVSEFYLLCVVASLNSTPAVYNENGPPLDIADRLIASMPNKVSFLVQQRASAGIAATVDK